MRSDKNKGNWQSLFSDDVRYVNVVVVLYKSELSITGANTSKQSIEIFALNYGRKYLTHSSVDVESSAYIGPLNASNLHENIFGSISKKPHLFIHTITPNKESVSKISVQRGNETLVDLGSADYYLSNFLRRNLRAKDVLIQQVLDLETFRENGWPRVLFYSCSVKNEKIYGEMYNSPTGESRDYYQGSVY